MIWLIGYIGTILAANAALEVFGIVPLGLGISAPAGVFLAGIAFTMRDLVHESLGRRWVVGAILAGAVLSWAISPQFAAASGIAFLLSELCDFAVYAPLRRRHWLGAVALSNTVGLLVDSALFLTLAFGSLAFIEGQILGKLLMTVLALPLLYLLRRRVVQAAVLA